jgi:hypothetical protein
VGYSRAERGQCLAVAAAAQVESEKWKVEIFFLLFTYHFLLHSIIHSQTKQGEENENNHS